MEIDKSYYVYIYWRLDTNEPFYIGKGKDNRWKRLDGRNKYFSRIVNKYPVTVEIVKDNLTEEQANGIECWLINELVFECGYSIDIPKNRSGEKGCHLVNMTWGGEGSSGCNPWENMTEEKKNTSREIHKIKTKLLWENEEYKKKMKNRKGMIGKHHSDKSRKKISKARKGKYMGENNNMYGKHHTEETKQLLREKHKDDVGKFIICITTKKIFKSIRSAERYYNISHGSIGKCCNNKYKSAGKLKDGTPLIWKFLIWNHNKKFKVNFDLWR